MPAQKRTFVESLDDEDTSTQLHYHRHAKQSRRDGQLRDEEQDQQNDLEQQDADGVGAGAGAGATASGGGQEEHDEEKDDDDDDDDGGQGGADGEQEEEDDSEGGPSSATEDKLEFVYVELSEIRKDVQCPICLGIIKKTRTVMECLHRFCRECIDKSMRLGNNECPACRTHCASRRSLRDDPNYDAIIATLYPDIEKYEEEELTFLEEEKARNKQIQASIAKIVQRQSEALGKKRPSGKDTVSTFSPRLRNNRNSHLRRRNHTIDLHGSEENDDENDNNVEKDSSSADERSTTFRQRRRKRRARTRNSHPSSSMASPDGETAENDADISKENRGISPGLVSNPEMLAWGPRGARSHTRHGGASGGNNKSSRSTRLSKFVEHLRSLDENNDELDVHLMLVSLEKESAPSLTQPYLCCHPTLSIKHLCEYIARQTPLRAEEVEILSLKGCFLEPSASNDSDLKQNLDPTALIVDPSNAERKTMEDHETLGTIRASCISIREHMILAYRRKVMA